MALFRIEPFKCPWCDEYIGPWAKNISSHAESHRKTSQDVYDSYHEITEHPTCSCSITCTKKVRWNGWSRGYAQFVRGHASADIINQRGKSRAESLASGHFVHWTRKDKNKSVLRSAAAKTSKTLREKYRSGKIKHWAAGETKETNPVIANHAKMMMGSKHHFYDKETLLKLFEDKLKGDLVITTSVDKITKRKNNREMLVTLECKSCGDKRELSIYNIVRKKKQRCRRCDVPKRWVSKGELEMVNVLKEMFETVKTQVWINGWSIDVYVQDLNTYLQYDGAYWHGLDRARDKITDPKILKKIKTDSKQNVWFKSNNIPLVRIFETDWIVQQDKRAFLEERLTCVTKCL